MKIDQYCGRQKDSPGSVVDYSNEQIMHKLEGWVSLTNFQGHIFFRLQHSVFQKLYKIELCLQWQTDRIRMSWMIYPVVSFLMTLSDSKSRFQGHAIIWHWISQKQYMIDLWLLQTSNRKWYVAYRIVLLPVTLIDLQGHFSYFIQKIRVAYFSSHR